MAFMMARSRAEPWALMTVPFKPEQRRAAVDFRVHAALDGAESASASSAPSLRSGLAVSSRLEHCKHRLAQALAGLQNDVADEAIADHDIDAIVEQIVAFDVADEIQIELLAEFDGFARQLVAFGFLACRCSGCRRADSGMPRISRE